jgi:hypothetical protein
MKMLPTELGSAELAPTPHWPAIDVEESLGTSVPLEACAGWSRNPGRAFSAEGTPRHAGGLRMFFAALSPELARLVFALPASSPVLVSTLAGFASSNCLRVLRLTLHKIRFRIAGAKGFAYYVPAWICYLRKKRLKLNLTTNRLRP